MRVSYYPDTDTLYIELSEAPGASTRECAKDLVVDLDINGVPAGIEIEHASEKVDLYCLHWERVPLAARVNRLSEG